MRCMTAIWPAGPPKLSRATRVQTRTASPRLTPCGVVSRRPPGGTVIEASFMSGSRLPDGPVVGLIGRVPAPAVERVVEGHPGLELLKVVGVHPREPERGCQKPRRLGREVRPGGIGATHDGGQPQ